MIQEKIRIAEALPNSLIYKLNNVISFQCVNIDIFYNKTTFNVK